MRQKLQQLMESAGHTGHSLYELSGVPAPTTYRFLNGEIGEPRSATVRRWARVYGLTEDQLRGSGAIDGVTLLPQEATVIRLESVLTRDELAAIEGMRKLPRDTRRAWLKIGRELVRADLAQERNVTKNKLDRDEGESESAPTRSRGKGVRYSNQTERRAISRA